MCENLWICCFLKKKSAERHFFYTPMYTFFLAANRGHKFLHSEKNHLWIDTFGKHSVHKPLWIYTFLLHSEKQHFQIDTFFYTLEITFLKSTLFFTLSTTFSTQAFFKQTLCLTLEIVMFQIWHSSRHSVRQSFRQSGNADVGQSVRHSSEHEARDAACHVGTHLSTRHKENKNPTLRSGTVCTCIATCS
jgi:hypothetical protein